MCKNMRKDEIIKHLKLQPLAEEGGFFTETYRSMLTTSAAGKPRNLLSVIYFLVTADTGGRNYLHCNESDHVHFFHCGWPLEYTVVTPEGELKKFVLGPDLSNGDMFQLTVNGRHLKAARLMTERTECAGFPGETPFALISESVAPGFEYEDRCCLNSEDVRKLHPKLHDQLIEHIPANRKSCHNQVN